MQTDRYIYVYMWSHMRMRMYTYLDHLYSCITLSRRFRRVSPLRAKMTSQLTHSCYLLAVDILRALQIKDGRTCQIRSYLNMLEGLYRLTLQTAPGISWWRHKFISSMYTVSYLFLTTLVLRTKTVRDVRLNACQCAVADKTSTKWPNRRYIQFGPMIFVNIRVTIKTPVEAFHCLLKL